ncbi:MAG TPA: RodZ domain-containing protein [Usitatibacter sp.]
MESVDDNADNAASRTLGQTLAAQRERQGLSRADAAQRLHMSAYQIEAIETGDYSRLPKGTFLRGFVRNYAKVLGVSADEALALLPEHAPRDQKPGIVVPTQNIRFDPIGDRLQNPYVKAASLAVVAIAVGFAAMYWWLFIKPTPPGSAAARKAAATKVAGAPPAAESGPGAVPIAVSEPARSEPVKTEPPRPEAKQSAPKADVKPAAAPKSEAKPAAPPKVEPPAPAGREVLKAGASGSVLKFVFKGSSWVEIRDAKGRILLSQLNPAGTRAEVSGKAPFNVIVGNAPQVQFFYNDHEFDLEPHTKVAVARFTVE